MTVSWLNKWKMIRTVLARSPGLHLHTAIAEFKRHRASRDLYKFDFYCKHSFCKCTEKETRVWKLESYKKRKETKDTRGQREEKKKDDGIYFLFRAVNKNISTKFSQQRKKNNQKCEKEWARLQQAQQREREKIKTQRGQRRRLV